MQRSVSYMGTQGEADKDTETAKNLHLLIESATAPRLAPNSCNLQLSQPSSPIIGNHSLYY